MMSGLVTLLLLLLTIGLWLFSVWRTLAPRDGLALACLIAGNLVLAIGVRIGHPLAQMSPLWAPFLYPYSASGIAAVFWACSQLHISRSGLVASSNPKLSAFFLAQLVLHAGIIIAIPFSHGRSLGLYLMVPPAMVLFSLVLYWAICWQFSRQQHARISWLSLAMIGLALPYAWLKLCEFAVPTFMLYF